MYTYIPKCNPLSVYSFICMQVFGADHVVLDIQVVCLLWGRQFLPFSTFLVVCSTLCSLRSRGLSSIHFDMSISPYFFLQVLGIWTLALTLVRQVFLKLLRHVFNSNTVPLLNDIHRNIRCAYSIQCLTVPAPTKSHVSSLFTFTSIFYNPMTVPEIIRAFPKVGPTHYCIWGIQGHTSAERKK